MSQMQAFRPTLEEEIRAMGDTSITINNRRVKFEVSNTSHVRLVFPSAMEARHRRVDQSVSRPHLTPAGPHTQMDGPMKAYEDSEEETEGEPEAEDDNDDDENAMDIDVAESPLAQPYMDIDDTPDLDFNKEFGDIDLSGIPTISTDPDVDLDAAYDFDKEFGDVDLSGIPTIRSDIGSPQEYDFDQEFADVDFGGIPVIRPEHLFEKVVQSSSRPSGLSGYDCKYVVATQNREVYVDSERLRRLEKGKDRAIDEDGEIGDTDASEDAIPLHVVQHLLKFAETDGRLDYIFTDEDRPPAPSKGLVHGDNIDRLLGRVFNIQRRVGFHLERNHEGTKDGLLPSTIRNHHFFEQYGKLIAEHMNIDEKITYAITEAHRDSRYELTEIAEGHKFRYALHWGSDNPEGRYVLRNKFDYFYDDVGNAERPRMPYKYQVNEEQLRGADCKIKFERPDNDYLSRLNTLRSARINQMKHQMYQANVLTDVEDRLTRGIDLLNEYV